MLKFRGLRSDSKTALNQIKKGYEGITGGLGILLTLEKIPMNLERVNISQRALSDIADHVMQFSDFFTAEKVELIWDLLHEAKNYLIGSNYEQSAITRCETFANRYVSGEKARQALLNLHSILPDTKYRKDLSRILFL